jgi:hypothetical protein
VSQPLNLASRPVRNERLPALLFAVATVLMIGVTVQHALLVRRLWPDTPVRRWWPARSAALEREVVGLRNEMKNLESQSGRKRREQVTGAQSVEWQNIRELVDGRAFWWSELFASFEEVLPPDVRIVTITPRVEKEHYVISLVAHLASMESGIGFIRKLEDRPEFEKVYSPTCSEQQGASECRYEMLYLGRGTEPKAGSAPPTGALGSLAPGAPGEGRGGDRR